MGLAPRSTTCSPAWSPETTRMNRANDEGSEMSARLDAPPPASADVGLAARVADGGRRLSSRIATMSLVELRKIRHDRTELYMRAIQPALWLLIFGETFTSIHAIPTTNGIPYLDYLAPGVMAQSALFISIFYGIQ